MTYHPHNSSTVLAQPLRVANGRSIARYWYQLVTWYMNLLWHITRTTGARIEFVARALRFDNGQSIARYVYMSHIWKSNVTHMNESSRTTYSFAATYRILVQILRIAKMSHDIITHTTGAHIELFCAIASYRMDESWHIIHTLGATHRVFARTLRIANGQ